jgi:hypothetical protein
VSVHAPRTRGSARRLEWKRRTRPRARIGGARRSVRRRSLPDRLARATRVSVGLRDRALRRQVSRSPRQTTGPWSRACLPPISYAPYGAGRVDLHGTGRGDPTPRGT